MPIFPRFLSVFGVGSRVALAFFIALLAVPAWGHPAPFSYLDLNLQPDSIAGSVRVHVIDAAHELGIDEPSVLLDQDSLASQGPAVERMLQKRMEFTGRGIGAVEWLSASALPQDNAIDLRFRIQGPPPPSLGVDVNLFPYDPAHQTFVNIYEDSELRQQWIFDASTEPKTHFAGSAAGVLAVLGTFIPAGVEHILIGPDHVLFLVGLLLLGGTFKRLAIIVTSFTLGHSITLALAALDIVQIPAAVVEPVIALSIIVVGVDNLLRGEGRDLRAYLAAVFGLVHGFGFAGVLREFGLPQANLAWSLFGFNLGVEIGQLAIVVVLALLFASIRNRGARAERYLVTIGSLAVVAAGAYWFVERTFLTGSGAT